MDSSVSFPAISVILPVYNADNYVAEAVESILAQTFSDYELLLIDDGSTDGSLAILQRYAARDDRIVLISRENRGLVASLNEGIALARGKWLARMDADDIALPRRFERQIAWLNQTHADICGSWVQTFGARSVMWRYPVSHEASEVQLLFDVPVAHPVVMAHRDVFRSLKYDSRFAQVEDYDIWQRAWAAGFKFANIDEALLRYRTHAEQVSVTQAQAQREASQSIRLRHWQAVLGSRHWPAIEQVLKTFDGNGGDLSLITPALASLRDRYSGEARDVLMINSFRLFCRAAAHNAEPWKLWQSLTKGIPGASTWKKPVILGLLRGLRMQPASCIFEYLRSFYLR
jgi:glycosyltransferase involved in cell wall biosynthesis